jgi:hypothetical protein
MLAHRLLSKVTAAPVPRALAAVKGDVEQAALQVATQTGGSRS